MKIVLTGANGFVGAEAFAQLIRDGHHVLAVDSLRYGGWRISSDEDTAQLVRLDLRDCKRTIDVIEAYEPDAVIHLAAVHFIPECEQLPHDAVSINVEATVNMLLACPPGCRFVFASTAAVYAPSDVPHDEGAPVGPMDVYGHTKLAAEQLVRHFAESKELDAVIVRLFNVVGPGETNPHVLPEIIGQLRRGARTLALGNTSPKRDYIYVGDAAAGFIAAATRPLPTGGRALVANLGTGAAHSVDEMVALMSEVLGEDIVITTDPARVRRSDRPHLCAANDRFRVTFDWTPTHDIRRSLRATWQDPRMSEQTLWRA